MVDLAFFVMILLLVIIVFGVILQSIVNPETELKWDILNAVFYYPYFQMYGELFLEDGLFKRGIVLSCKSSLPCCRRRYFTWYFSLNGFAHCKYQVACMYSPNQRCLIENFASWTTGDYPPLHRYRTRHYTSSDLGWVSEKMWWKFPIVLL